MVKEDGYMKNMKIIYREKTMVVEGLPAFDAAQTLDCGQCFQFAMEGDVWKGITNGHASFIRQEDSRLVVEEVSSHPVSDGYWRRYLDLDRDYEDIMAELWRLEPMRRCMAYAPGIRVLRQPPWEALVAFIISQNNNVPRIKGIIRRLCETYGAPTAFGWDFPEPEVLAMLEEGDLAVLRCGWRAAYILDAARKVASGALPLEQIAVLPLEEARQALQTIKGVGPKVAECVLLYGMGRMEAFPMDVWMKRAMQVLFDGRPSTIFGEYAGIAQQYIFHYCRTHPNEVKAG